MSIQLTDYFTNLLSKARVPEELVGVCGQCGHDNEHFCGAPVVNGHQEQVCQARFQGQF